MPRIRSIHPGQWTDADFVNCSPHARLLAIAIRNFADDGGVFEWKPTEIRMRCFPGDNVEIGELLSELIAHKQVSTYTLDGVHYGQIRNFTRYQRPKEPKFLHPQQPSSAATSEVLPKSPELRPPDSGRPGETYKQREEVPCSLGVVDRIPSVSSPGKPGKRARLKAEYPEDFEVFWRVYPRREGKGNALKAWKTALNLTDQATIIASLARPWPADETKIPHPATYLNGRRWEDEIKPEPNGASIFEGMDP